MRVFVVCKGIFGYVVISESLNLKGVSTLEEAKALVSDDYLNEVCVKANKFFAEENPDWHHTDRTGADPVIHSPELVTVKKTKWVYGEYANSGVDEYEPARVRKLTYSNGHEAYLFEALGEFDHSSFHMGNLFGADCGLTFKPHRLPEWR